MRYSDLDLNLIKTFLTVYESKSILLASKKLFVSQPAVTFSIKKLEDFLGGKLFIRTPKGVMPTVAGEEFNKACYNSMQILENGINKFLSLSNLQTGVLNIGSSSTIIRKILLPFIENFSKKYPKVIITVTDANSFKLTNYVKSGRVDLAILNMPIQGEEMFIVHPLVKTHDCFIAGADFKKNNLSLKELAKEKLIVQKRPSSNRDFFEMMCKNNDIILKPNYEVGSFGLLTDFASKNMGIAYTIREFVEDDIKSGRVKEIKTDFVASPRDISIITSQTSTNSFVCDKFIQELKDYFKIDKVCN